MKRPLPETVQRLRALIAEKDLEPSEYLGPKELADKTALPLATIETLLSGGTPPADTVNDRVCARIKTLADKHASTPREKSDLVAEIAARLGISQAWARKVVDGEKMPNVDALHGLSNFFGVDGEERFFTASAEDALNRILSTRLEELQDPPTDPFAAIMEHYGVKSTDLRSHASLTPEQFRMVVDGIMRSFMPPRGDDER
ncbi:helix-turn-helix transcriptional regulator [Streptomyces sp. NBC_00243]|uniref:helix-turn-helix transcriptional regulator n=1 Tax=Streptomyces sp. NBC_00243 TaxID=2975688 RepID=UPI002DD88870|nr:helix-turn-helix transcriptional regulator [Streptomyces sp. NBC_00243]WRZ24393.1 helix-turn-helix transcriptional regulator [Streptomyces sp. NBC_00243]